MRDGLEFNALSETCVLATLSKGCTLALRFGLAKSRRLPAIAEYRMNNLKKECSATRCNPNASTCLAITVLFLGATLTSNAIADGKCPPVAGPDEKAAPTKEATKQAKVEENKVAKDGGTKTSVLDALAVAGSGKSMLATTQLARVFTPINALPDMISPKESLPAMGFDLTASLPVENATFLDYFRHELLARRGGLLNLYMSYTGRNPCPASGELVNFRLAETDRVYFSRDSPDKQKALFFWSHGVGGRILKTDLPGTKTAGMFTAYVGVGVDGPLFTEALDTKVPPGVFSLETFFSYNALNKRTLKEAFTLASEQRSYSTFGINFRFNLPGSYQIKVEHMKGLGSFGRDTLGDLTLLSIAYKRPD